jgi:hypothetical protein
MILYLESPNGYRNQFPINSEADFYPIAAIYPQVIDIARDCESLEEAANEVALYLSSHFMDAWVEGNGPLQKGFKDKAIALGMAASTFISSAGMMPHQPSPAPPVKIEVAPHKRSVGTKKPTFGSRPEDKFLWATMQVESSNGKNTQHQEIKSGKFKGEKAIGRWGLLKPTIDEMLNRKRHGGRLDGDMAPMATMNRDQTEEYLKINPQLELDLARDLAQHVIKRNGGDLKRASYAWLYGHNLSPADITNDHIHSEPYVQKFAMAYPKAPFKKTRAEVTSLIKTKSPTDFKRRLSDWTKHREELNRKLAPPSSNSVQDPGRIREEELDQIQTSDKGSHLDRLRRKVDETKKS